jgi:hypothetical protein
LALSCPFRVASFVGLVYEYVEEAIREVHAVDLW